MSQPREFMLYVGTYTRPLPHVDGHGEGIYRLRLDADTGALAFDGVAARVTNPTFLAPDPVRPQLYTVTELDVVAGRPGAALHTFALDMRGGAGRGMLTRLNWRRTGGAASCHVTVDRAGRCVLTANYNGGNVTVLPIGSDGRVGPMTQQVAHTGSGPNPTRQERPHPHGVYFDLTGRYLLVPDLGIDKVCVYRFDAEPAIPRSHILRLHPAGVIAGLRSGCSPLATLGIPDAKQGALTPHTTRERGAAESKNGAAIHPGAGPRHLALHPNGRWVYCANELDATVSVLAFDPASGTLTEQGWVSLLPCHSEGDNSKNLSSAAEIECDASGRFVYASIRGHDSIALFAAAPDGSTLTLLGHEPTRGRTPRHFALSPDGRLLVAANQDSDSLVTFHVDADTGRLTPTGHSAIVPSPACVLMLNI